MLEQESKDIAASKQRMVTEYDDGKKSIYYYETLSDVWTNP